MILQQVVKRLRVLALAAAVLSGCVTEFWGKTLPSAYSHPGPMHDVYRASVIGCDGVVFTVIAVEVPFSCHAGDGGASWYVIPIDMDTCLER